MTIYLTRDSFCMGDDCSAPHLHRILWLDKDWYPESNMFYYIEEYLGPNLPGYFWRGYANGKHIMDVSLYRDTYEFSRSIVLCENWRELLRENTCIHFLHTEYDRRDELPITLDINYHTFEEAEELYRMYYTGSEGNEDQG